MFDIGWTELLVIGVVALIVIGPKDLPAMFHTLGRFTAKARSMAREFSRAMEDAAKESGMSDVTKDLRAVANPKSFGMEKVKEAASKFESWDPMKSDDTAKPREMGPNTKALSEERAEAARKIHEYSAQKTQARLDAEAAKADASAEAPAKTAKPATAPKTKKATAKTAAKKPAGQKAPAAKKSATGAKTSKTTAAKSAKPKAAKKKPAAKPKAKKTDP